MTRRQFVQANIAAAGTVLAWRLAGRLAIAREVESWPPKMAPVKIHKLYAGITERPYLPRPTFDYKPEIAKFEKQLAHVERQLGDVKFVGGELITSPEDVSKVAANLRNADGLLIIHFACNVRRALKKLVDMGLPTVIFDQPFSGHEWMAVTKWQREGKKVLLLATSDYQQICAALELLRVPALMRQTRIIAVPGRLGGTGPDASKPDYIRAHFGTRVVPVSNEQLIEVHKSIDVKAAEKLAEREWMRPAKKIVEPSREEIVRSARQYLALKKVMMENQAQACLIDCLGGLPIEQLGYPCFAFSKLDDEGLVGACEADIDSTLTKLIFKYAFNKPGFITDPVFDTSKNALMHFHCTAPTRMDGPAGPRAPFTIRSHMDDDRGAALEVEMRLGQVITCAKLVNLDTMLISTGKITEIPDFDDRGCRTQITTEVADARKMLANWCAGADIKGGIVEELHRVVFYGDHLQSIKDLAVLMGLKVIEEI
jgi:hypothetical protein